MDRLTIITMRLLLCQYIYNHNVIIPYYYDNMFLQCYVITELLDVIIATSAHFRNRLVVVGLSTGHGNENRTIEQMNHHNGV